MIGSGAGVRYPQMTPKMVKFVHCGRTHNSFATIFSRMLVPTRQYRVKRVICLRRLLAKMLAAASWQAVNIWWLSVQELGYSAPNMPQNGQIHAFSYTVAKCFIRLRLFSEQCKTTSVILLDTWGYFYFLSFYLFLFHKTGLRCGRKYNKARIAKLMLNPSVKEFWKSANICPSYA